MFHQKIPSYDGAQPFIYAVYCKEDEALAWPVLARMYNEGFRVCCAASTGISSDYYKQQRMSSASGVIIFMSRIMADRLRLGDPDAVAAARSPLLRTIVLLDETDVSNNVFAMSVPDHQQYLPQNDSAFWLYVYSNDYFDACRGKWPEKQLLLRDPSYEDINAEVVGEEYRRLESIMTGNAPRRRAFDRFEADDIYMNNTGYIEPQPDEFTYEPLAPISIVRTEHDDQLDEVLGLIDKAENDVEQSRLRTAQATAAAAEAAQNAAKAVSDHEARLTEEKSRPEEPPISIFAGKDEPTADTVEQPEQRMKQSDVNEEAPQQIAAEEAEALSDIASPQAVEAQESEKEEIEAEPKADLIVTPVEKPEPAEEKAAEPEIEITEEITPVTEEESAAAAETIMASAEVLLEELPEEAEEPVIAEPAAAEQQETAAITAPPVRRSSVPVMVRRQQHRRIIGKVEVRKRRTVHLSSTPTSGHRTAMHLSSVPGAEGIVPHAISSSITFEQYVRDIARTCVSEMLEQPEEAAAVPAVPARKHRQRAAVNAAPAVGDAQAQPQYTIELVEADSKPDDGEEAKASASARKSRHPHQKNGLFSSIVNAFRRERRNTAEGSGESDDDAAGGANAAGDTAKAESNTLAEKPGELQLVVEKFIECNAVPSVTVVPRTMVRRYRD